MLNLKRAMIRILAVIFSIVLGTLLILGVPASAIASDNCATFPCDVDPIACLKEIFVDKVQMGRIKEGQVLPVGLFLCELMVSPMDA